MKVYDHKKIEKKWQALWDKKQIYKAKDFSKKPKFYGLIEFPYPSGAGLHVGHIRSNTAMDIISRKRRMEGYNVLYPIGWDAFGLPTENYAIKSGIHPIKVTKDNTDTFRRQLKSLGFSFDWSREINTTDPKYYKWTQWIFLQFFKKGLAYKTRTEINWCPSCKIGLANEEVVGGMCERCGGPTEKREKEQWMLAITKYADRLDKDLDTVDYLPKIKIQQRNWIGKSEGINITYPIEGFRKTVTVFTTRPDTNFGATFIALAPDGEFVKKNLKDFPKYQQVRDYISGVKKKTDIERLAEGRKKTGVFTGLYVVNGLNNKKIPMYVADFVLGGVGTGALVGVPGHDLRDFEFAQEMNLEIVRVVVGPDGDTSPITRTEQVQEETGIMTNSGFLDGMDIHFATKKMMDRMENLGMGKRTVTYKLRDWVFSRQRYWGEPIPLIFCSSCVKASADKENSGWVPVPDKDLPVVLPKVANYKPTDDGESPLAHIGKWVNVKCPKCKGKAKRETDTMPNWAGSSWYYLRYTDPKNNKEFASKKNLDYWVPKGVDWYNGGMEHTTLHLLYSRFWHKFLYDLKLVPTSEPYMKRTSHGLILADDGTKFSKSKGNGIDPEDLVKRYGADTVRMYEMFMGPFDQAVSWNTDSLIGPRRFLERVWKIGSIITLKGAPVKNSGAFALGDERTGNPRRIEFLPEHLSKLLHKTIKKVSEDIEEMRFNTAVSSMMVLLNKMEKGEVNKEDFIKFLQILAPFAPHITEELWSNLGNKDSVHLSIWPKWDKNKITEEKMKIVVQVNGKMRTEIMIEANAEEEEVKNQALLNEVVLKYASGKDIKKVFYVKNRLINIVL
ncbi:leucine--tRNA ligase [Candidatus Nomurabacteria bacterium RIFCSPHIGHO2_01_FULL_40_12]|uniref:Leucine--tRNA ligase n=1 Tax=Candidatus Nomurabacteria bacterium RIFCSPHIGHO2_01_FULL_40_12 TaxID=1801737 RepID=A0A1F6V028_9BACT|nr:MAG: leucine--tRNA ligase [Candidatus Nomurabacteria bacterium RIFCSPHIGHO2_01_FULL_40_12]